MSNQISRRDFLKGAAAGAAGLASMSALGGLQAVACTPPHVQEDPATITWDYEADVVVIGSGGSGLPAALKAMEEGASVMIVECEYDVGGHAATSGGNLHSGGGTAIQKKYGIEDSADLYYSDHTAAFTIQTRFNDREACRGIADDMCECYEFLQEKGLLVQDREPTNNYGLGKVDPPINGDTVPRWTYTDSTTERFTTYFGGPSGGGISITRPLERTLRAQGCKFLLNYHMDKIVREQNMSGKVLGIMAGYKFNPGPDGVTPMKSLWSENNIDESKPTVYIKANKGVIVATGGSVGCERFRTMIDPRLKVEFDGTAGAPFSEQDASGEYACMAIGAALGGLAQYQQHGGHQIAMARRWGCRYGYSNSFPASPIWHKIRANGLSAQWGSAICVNMLGERHGNEDYGAGGTYSYDSYIYHNTAFSSVLHPSPDGELTRYGGPLWAIFDHAAVERHNFNLEQGSVDWEDGRFFKGDTLEELANNVVNKYYEHIKMDPEKLVAQVKRYNEAVEKGVDEEWGKWTLDHKIEKGPFYAAWAMPSMHDTYGGVRVNRKMQVLDLWDQVIPGLYAVGECAGNIRAHGFGRVFTTGFVAGKNAARD